MSEFIAIDRTDHVLSLTLDRPAKKNALTADMYAALTAALRDAEADREVRVVVLSARGDAFCAGNDIGDFVAANSGDFVDAPVRFLSAIAELSVPIVAAVHGAAIGIGTTMLLHCDVVCAAHDATFRMPFVDLALTPEAASTYLLPALIGHHRAARLLLMAEPFDAATAHELGLIAHVVRREELLESARGIAAEIAAKPPEAVRATKRLMKAPHREAIARAFADEFDEFGRRLTSAEAQERFAAFFARTPSLDS